MFQSLRTIKGQGFFVQYASTFFLVVGVIAAMALLVRRSVQGRLFEAHDYSFKQVRQVVDNPAYNIQGQLWAQYEPYYLNSTTIRSTSQELQTAVKQGGREGFHDYILPADQNVSHIHTEREQTSPEFAD